MSSWDDSDYDSWDDYGDDYDDYGYYYASKQFEDIFPLEFLPFCNICEAAMGYLDTQQEYPLYDATMIEFLTIAEVAISGTAYVYEPKFYKFLLLPAELRLKVYTHYLKTARDNSTLAKHLHVGRSNNPCCTWCWPEELIICDRNSENELPTAKYAPWLPALAFTNMQLLGEVTIYMLSTTEWFDFKYDVNNPFKIVPWFTAFLSTFSTVTIRGVATTEAFAAIKRINFPHASKYNEFRKGRIIDEKNPDITLMLKCTELETIAMTFHWRNLVYHWGIGKPRPRDLEEFLDFFHFEPMLEHKGVKNVYLEGQDPQHGAQYGPQFEEAQTLLCLYEFGKWLVKGFRKRGREVNVHVHTRCKVFEKRSVRPKLVVDEEVAKAG